MKRYLYFWSIYNLCDHECTVILLAKISSCNGIIIIINNVIGECNKRKCVFFYWTAQMQMAHHFFGLNPTYFNYRQRPQIDSGLKNSLLWIAKKHYLSRTKDVIILYFQYEHRIYAYRYSKYSILAEEIQSTDIIQCKNDRSLFFLLI